MPKIPNRSEDLARPRSRQGQSKSYEVSKGDARPVAVPEPNPAWCDVANQLWHAATTSGQADYYQQTDWAVLYLTLDQVSFLYEQPKRSPEFLKAIYSALGSLMFTEADRRKAHVELMAPDDGPENTALAALADYREVLGVAN